MKTIREERRGKYLLRLVQTPQCYSGIVLADGKIFFRIDGEDAREVWEELERGVVAGFGFGGARVRFLETFPEGFTDPDYLTRERRPKLHAKQRLDEDVPLEEAVSANGQGEEVLPVYQALDLPSKFEKMRVKDALKGENAAAFIRAAARFTLEPSQQALQTMKVVLKPYAAATWPVMTYLPFLWRPSFHMFLKPMVTKDYASRVGHRFADDYSPEIGFSVYESLLDLAAATEWEIADLRPADRIDIQSFIWVVEKYPAVSE